MAKTAKPKQYGILVDLDYCLGCGICVIACKQENNLPPFTEDEPNTGGLAWNQVLSITYGKHPDLARYYLPVHCMHCEEPPCLPACPKQAIYKREDGFVLIAKGKCNACVDQPGGVKKCIPACPYGAIQFNESKGVVEACTMCVHRIDANSNAQPACVRACIGRCLSFGDFNDPNSNVSKKVKQAGKNNVFVLKPEKKSAPSLKYIKPKGVGVEKVARLDLGSRMFGFQKQPHV